MASKLGALDRSEPVCRLGEKSTDHGGETVGNFEAQPIIFRRDDGNGGGSMIRWFMDDASANSASQFRRLCKILQQRNPRMQPRSKEANIFFLQMATQVVNRRILGPIYTPNSQTSSPLV